MPVFEDHYWNLLQVLAWVYRGDRRLVRQAKNAGESLRSLAEIIQADNAPAEGAVLLSLAESEGQILRKLQAGDIVAVGRKDNRGDPISIPTSSWASLVFYYEPIIAGPADPISSPDATCWYDLRFPREQILELWPDSLARLASASSEIEAHEAEPLASIGTGAPGRPNASYRVLDEFNRRQKAGEPIPDSLAEAADELHDWWEKNRGNAPPLTKKTIENVIRDRHRDIRAAPKDAK